jgi:hypothetical protein
MTIFEPSSLALAASIGVIAIAAVAGLVGAHLTRRHERLPDATRYEDVRERRITEERRLDAIREELRLAEQAIQLKDRVTAELAALQRMLEEARLEYANLAPAREEIEDVKREAAEVAGALATKLQEKKIVEEQVAQLESELQDKQRELETIMKGLDRERIASLQEALGNLKAEKASLEAALPQLRAERDSALQRIAEARAAEARRAIIALEIEGLETQHAELAQLRDELTKARTELHGTKARHDELNQEQIRLEAYVARLRDEAAGTPTDTSLLLDDLRQEPACLASPRIIGRAPKDEIEALGTVSKYLKDYGLDYDRRTLNAFHTCLKINDYAQITVLAGVSGTGKSLLPRRYAEAMGIHFHQIAVEPRWDSPQDLLGFYNYIERKYRATDLARLLVHMDPYRTVALPDGSEDSSQHVALVLLDEMNLARVEYYFSEFLSRLEVRPRRNEADEKDRRKNALIPIDIRGYETPVTLFPSHNVLFAGTMNDDESTQALSDKVLDRGNVIQFAAPNKFQQPANRQTPSAMHEALNFKSWSGWVRPSSNLNEKLEIVDGHIERLARIMDGCGKPFGHRLRDAILSYVANHPQSYSDAKDMRIALVDQIELRIFPKLRGIEIAGHDPELDQLASLIRNDLDDAILADRLEDVLARQRSGTGLFVWRGMSRQRG